MSTFATQLGLLPSAVNAVGKGCTTVSEHLHEVLLEWLKQNYDTDRFGLPSWRLLCAAVASEAGGGNKSLAAEIAAKHPCIISALPESAGILEVYMYIACTLLPLRLSEYIHNRESVHNGQYYVVYKNNMATPTDNMAT